MTESLTGASVVRESEITADHVLQEPLAGLFAELDHHLAQDHCHVREPVICLAYVVESRLIKQNLLEDEGGHSLAQLRPALHDPKAEWNDLGGQKKVDHLLLVRLDEGSDDPE